MVDRGQKPEVEQAAARFADTLAESYRLVYEQAAESGERQRRLAQDFSERVMNYLRVQAESGRAASEQLADQARRQQEAGRELSQESVNAYMDFLNTVFSQYQAGSQRAAQSTAQSAREGARTLSETTTGLVGTATGAASAMADTTAEATRSTAEAAAGQPPIEGYDELNVEEVISRLDGLSEAELMRVRNYEQRNKSRQTILDEADRKT